MNGHRDGIFDRDRAWGLYAGTVVDRDDPEKLGRIRVLIPGLVEPQSNWALPKAGGATKWGHTHIPPVGCDVFVQFVNGDINMPVWEPGPFGSGEQFPEHLDPDISVFGAGPFRLVLDNRADVQTATFKIVKTVGQNEEDICTFEWNAATNSVRLFATTALQIEAGGLVDIDCAGDVQIKGRKVIPTGRAMS